jgi:hypothetical protein
MKTTKGRNGGTLKTLEKGDTLPNKKSRKGVPNAKTRLKLLLELIIERENPLTGAEKMTAAEAIDIALWNRAARGDVPAYREIIDRVDGKVSQQLEVNNTSMPTEIRLIRYSGKDTDVSYSEQEIKDREGL